MHIGGVGGAEKPNTLLWMRSTNNQPKTSPLPAGLYMFGRGLCNTHSITLFCCVLSVFPTKNGRWRQSRRHFFLFSRPKCSLAMWGTRVVLQQAQDRSRVWMNAISREKRLPTPEDCHFLLFVFRCRRRYCSRTNNLCTRFGRNKTKISIHVRLLLTDAIQMYLFGWIYCCVSMPWNLLDNQRIDKNPIHSIIRQGQQSVALYWRHNFFQRFFVRVLTEISSKTENFLFDDD